MKYDIIVAIDPDKEKSGVANLDAKKRDLKLGSMAFPDLLEYIQCAERTAINRGQSFIVVVEAGWMYKKSCFHEAQGKSAEKIAKDVGANHETGRKIIEMCKYWGIEVLPHIPLVKCWRGKDRKITDAEIKAFIPIQGRTNQESRDAALLAWVFAGLPVRVRPGNVEK